MSKLHFDVVGAEGPKQFFARLTTETIAHAYLFTARRESGRKLSRAVWLSRSCARRQRIM